MHADSTPKALKGFAMHLTLAAVLAGLMFSGARADECLDKAMSQPEINACATKAYEASDAELNHLYKQIGSRLKDDAESKKHFVTAQRAWIAYRDAECAFQGADKGSSSAMVYGYCLASLTADRVKDFKAYLSCGDTGDLSCPVPAAQ